MSPLSAKIKLKDSETSLDWTLIEQTDTRIVLYFKRFLDDFPLYAFFYKNNDQLKIEFIACDLKGKVLIENGYGYTEAYSDGHHKLKVFDSDEFDKKIVKASFIVNTIEDDKGDVIYIAKSAIMGGFLTIGKEVYSLGNYRTNADVLYAAAYTLSPGISWTDYAAAAGIPEDILEDPKS